MRILIVEEALETGAGHWPHYIGGLAAGFRAAGDEVDVLVHREATDAVVEQVGGTRWFSRNCFRDASCHGVLGGLRHAVRFGNELSRWCEGQPGYDHILLLTMRPQHLLGLALLCLRGKLQSESSYLLLFVQGFGRYAGPGKERVFGNDLSTRLSRWCFRILSRKVKAGKVRIAAETAGMQGELTRFTGLDTELYPHPIGKLCDGSNNQRKRFPEGDLLMICPGFARYEKGTDLLQEAIEELEDEKRLNSEVRFVLQWPEGFFLPNGEYLEASAKLEESGRVIYLNEGLSPEEYESVLGECDFVILPYRRNSYQNRVSRVAIESAGMGKPLIYMEDTWVGEVAEAVGSGIGITEETVAGVKEGILRAMEEGVALRQTAKQGQDTVRKYYSVNRFRDLLVSGGERHYEA